MASQNVKLSINYTPVNIEEFIRQFIDNVVTALLGSLKDTGEAEDIKLSIEGDTVGITENNNEIQLNAFTNDFVRNTVIGMVSSLKGVDQIDNLEINITR